jgi:Flp pilus assembly protein CpaB
MSPKSIILLAMALGCGLVAAVGINQIMARPSDQPDTVQIVVAKREIQKGEPFRPDDIRLQDWPKETVPEGALDSVEKLIDKRSRSMVYAGEAIIDKKLIGKGDMTSLMGELPPGMKAIAVKVDNESGLAGMVLPGDNVDVILHAEANPSKQIFETTTKQIESNMKVMAVDDVMDRPDGKETSVSAKTVTLLATPKQASRITHACAIGTVRLVLCSGKESPDASLGDGGDVNTPQLLGNVGGDDSSSGPKTGGGIVDLPPVAKVDDGTPFATGVDGIRDLLKTMKDTRDGVQTRPQPFTVVLIEGPDTREIEFDPGTAKGRKTPGLAHLKGSSAPASAGGIDEMKETKDTPPAEASPEQLESLQKIFNPQAQREGLKGGRTTLVQ